MPAPDITFTVTGSRISGVAGFDHVTCTFWSDIPYQAFQCRATKANEAWGVGKGVLVASFSQTPANVQRSFDIYDDFLLSGDGDYRLSLFAQGSDGSWNDNYLLIPSGSSGLMTSDGKLFLCVKE